MYYIVSCQLLELSLFIEKSATSFFTSPPLTPLRCYDEELDFKERVSFFLYYS